jgi:hypothetical protein
LIGDKEEAAARAAQHANDVQENDRKVQARKDKKKKKEQRKRSGESSQGNKNKKRSGSSR